MNILDLLTHHIFTLNKLWVSAFLPHLISPILLVLQLMKRQLSEDMLRVSFFQKINDLSRGEGFEIPDLFGQMIG